MHFVTIPPDELKFKADRGTGPGGQHKNKKCTRVRLSWNFEGSAVLSEQQRELIKQKLASRLNEAGALEIVSGEERSQTANRDTAIARLEQIFSIHPDEASALSELRS